ncbi:MAG: hypothetical protein HY014_10260 [Acidobacteria bacterium]|nr:hypothetical protein [Acidobacteriota bacterium]MBI3488539.1 hypothetical protein [Acidobacteriota bacterium]
MTSEDLWRATLHDFNNLLAGLQGALDLSDPRLPLDARNRLRLSTSIEEGKTLIAMARALALGRRPESGLVPWAEWKAGLEARMEPLAELFRCPCHLSGTGLEGSIWPAPLLQDWAAAFTRQILPWSVPGPLRLEASITPEAWVLTWPGDAPLPLGLKPDPSADTPKNLPILWLRALGKDMGIRLEETPGGPVARMPR